MKRCPFKSFLTLRILLMAFCIIPGCSNETKEEKEHESIEGSVQGGRLFKKDDITLELTLYEKGMSPHFRAYVYQKKQKLSPTDAKLTITLTRFNQKKEKISFVADGDFLQSMQAIREPHSFDVNIKLIVANKSYLWTYPSYEGRVELLLPTLEAASIQTEIAQSHTLKTQLRVVGKIVSNHDTMAPIYARYAGIIQSMKKNLGEEVMKGEPLVTVESNESLQSYTINAPITGTIIQKYATNGELAQSTKPIYDIANLNDVWADFTLYRKEVPLVKKGMVVRVTGDGGKPESISCLSYISPLGIEDSQTILARAILPNQKRHWLPGMYVNGDIIIKEKNVPVAVALSALQRMGEHDVVFVQQGNFFEATPVKLGQKDNQWVEVIEGLDAGQRYVTTNSFFIKAEIGKEGASHDH